MLPWELKSFLEPLDVERLMDHWRELYSEVFEVIETSGSRGGLLSVRIWVITDWAATWWPGAQ